MIQRRSLSDSLRYLAKKLEVALSDAERAGVAVTLNSLADENDQKASRGQRARRILVVAPFKNIADMYCRAIGATPETHWVVLDTDRLRALSPQDTVVVVTAHDPNRVLERADRYLRVSRATVTYVNIDTIMGVDRG